MKHTVDIDRIVLTGFGVTPDRAERIRTLLGVELQRLLESGGLPDGMGGGEVSHLRGPVIPLAGHNSDQHLANGLAQSVAQSLRGLG